MQSDQPNIWPAHLPKTLDVPQQPLNYYLDRTAAQTPEKPATIFYDAVIQYGQLKQYVDRLAGFLQHELNVQPGDRVLLMSQNSPQFTIAYYAILRARGVVIPVNVMTTAHEMAHYINDSQARVAIVAQDYIDVILPYLKTTDGLQHALSFSYQQALDPHTQPAGIPDWVKAPKKDFEELGIIDLHSVIDAPQPVPTDYPNSDDWCVFPYTSGTTGYPKGCIHTHYTMAAALLSSQRWRDFEADTVTMAVAPVFHVLGMQSGLNLPIFMGSTMVILPRWDREMAARAIDKHRVTYWSGPPTMVIDFFSLPNLDDYDLSSLRVLASGGAAIPEFISALVQEKYPQLLFNEAYGLSETAAFLHANPMHRPKQRCLGLPTFNVDSRIIDPDTGVELADDELGELVTHAPQVMLGYWNDEKANEESFIILDGKRFFRTGDLAIRDAEGYFFMRERLKRMINASGFKVWPAEVENVLYNHPAIQEACVIGIPDPHRGETVKAVVTLKEDFADSINADTLIKWCRNKMAAYKAPRHIHFVDELPKSSTGKILWRQLQEQHHNNQDPIVQ